MHLEKISMVSFRNFSAAEATFSSDLNLIYGLNAQGKTNFLEAIYLICLGRSFRVAKNQEMVKKDESFFIIDGNLTLDNQIKKRTVKFIGSASCDFFKLNYSSNPIFHDERKCQN